jgi:hypothetical protein
MPRGLEAKELLGVYRVVPQTTHPPFDPGKDIKKVRLVYCSPTFFVSA